MIAMLVLILSMVVTVAYCIEYFYSYLDDPREPRRVGPSIPLPVIGHLLGFARHGFDYYNHLSRNTNAEMYTVGTLNFKVYIASSPRIAQSAQKIKSLSFTPLLQVHNRIHADMSDEATRLFRGDILDSWSHSAKQALSPGLALNAQNLRMANQGLVEVMDLLKHDEIELLSWAKHAVVQATAAGLYGMHHPLKDPEIEEAMWVWDEQRLGHMVGIDPLGTGYRARAKVWSAFQGYFQNIPDDVSLLVKQRQDILRKAGISEAEAARMQSTLSDAAYPNTVPTLFWTVYEIFSRPQLLEVVRKEIYSSAVQKTDTGFVLDVTALKSKCQVLLSVYQETQRTRHYQVAFRAITEDILLDGHLLKKGNYLQILSKPTHQNPNIWGPDASTFDPYRFVPGQTKTRISPSSFQPWGVPPHMCPARQFASTEILIITALLCCRVDFAPVSSKGWIREPALRSMEIPSLPRPKKDVRLRVMERDDAVGSWAITMGDSKMRVPLASG